MTDDAVLHKTNRINLLFDMYRSLLTEKQQHIMRLYYQEDYSLGEIAENDAVSRQAVYEHIKRSVLALEEYEKKLQLLAKENRRRETIRELEQLLFSAEVKVQHEERITALLRKLGGDGDGV